MRKNGRRQAVRLAAQSIVRHCVALFVVSGKPPATIHYDDRFLQIISHGWTVMKAIAAMSLNRVIGSAGKIPWHLPDDFQWFKRVTSGHVVLMGRKTFESLGKPLPNRTNLVLTRRMDKIAGATVLHDPADLSESDFAPRDVFVIGGAEIYAQLLPRCRELYLSVVQREVAGDAFFPPFEEDFELIDIPLRHAEFEVRHYRNLHA